MEVVVVVVVVLVTVTVTVSSGDKLDNPLYKT